MYFSGCKSPVSYFLETELWYDKYFWPVFVALAGLEEFLAGFYSRLIAETKYNKKQRTACRIKSYY